jgi:hypothetical protein
VTAGEYYARIVRDHPRSDFDDPARGRLGELGFPLPEVNPAALARLDARPDPEVRSLASRMFGVFSGGPGVSTETTAASILVNESEEPGTGSGEFSVDGVVIDSGGPPGGP